MGTHRHDQQASRLTLRWWYVRTSSQDAGVATDRTAGNYCDLRSTLLRVANQGTHEELVDHRFCRRDRHRLML